MICSFLKKLYPRIMRQILPNFYLEEKMNKKVIRVNNYLKKI